MKRALFGLLLLTVSCHAVTIHVERGRTGAVERDDRFWPRPDFRKRYVSIPAVGLIDCFDLFKAADGGHVELDYVPCMVSPSEVDPSRLPPATITAAHRAAGRPSPTLSGWLDASGATLFAAAPAPACVPAASGCVPVAAAPPPRLSVGDGRYLLLPASKAAAAVAVSVDDGVVSPPQPAWAGAEVTLVPVARGDGVEAVAAFAHVSDVQIREPEAKLGGDRVSRRLDPLVPSFEHDYEQELFSPFVYTAIVVTINSEVNRLRAMHELRLRPGLAGDLRDEVMPTAMIHTGDAVDAGLQSEFDHFRRVSDILRIPWYQAVGNHDLLAFGNLELSPLAGAPGDHDDRSPAELAARRCYGEHWKDLPCTCTALSTLVREYNLRTPDNRGCETVAVPAKSFTLIPALLEKVCVVHRVEGDHFLMDPYRPDSYEPDGHLHAAPTDYRTSLGAFVAAHDRTASETSQHLAGREDWQPGYAVRPAGITTRHDAIEGKSGIAKLPQCGIATRERRLDSKRSKKNGFDLAPLKTPDEGDASSPLDVADKIATSDNLRGYYCFELEQEPGSSFEAEGRKIWFLVLNTSTASGAYGSVDGDQLAWLEDRLDEIEARHKGDLAVVFAHHPIWGIYDVGQRTRLLDLLGAHPSVVGFFAGHTHESMLRVVHPPGGHRFWEVIAPSTLVYPQQARLVQIKRLGDVGWFDVVSFSPASERDYETGYLTRALEGAKRDVCHQTPSRCAGGVAKPPTREVTFPRLYFPLPPVGLATNPDRAEPPTQCRPGWELPTWYPKAP